VFEAVKQETRHGSRFRAAVYAPIPFSFIPHYLRPFKALNPLLLSLPLRREREYKKLQLENRSLYTSWSSTLFSFFFHTLLQKRIKKTILRQSASFCGLSSKEQLEFKSGRNKYPACGSKSARRDSISAFIMEARGIKRRKSKFKSSCVTMKLYKYFGIVYYCSSYADRLC
jgi:hypothetical protein